MLDRLVSAVGRFWHKRKKEPQVTVVVVKSDTIAEDNYILPAPMPVKPIFGPYSVSDEELREIMDE